MKRVFVFAMFLGTGIMGASAQEDHCDVNGDGVVNIADVIYVVDHVLGKGHADTSTGEAGEAIDLGLPSKTKWASCNVGATKPEEYGGYYAWGETEEKETYTFENYIHCDGFMYTCHDLGEDISGTEYDVARMKWGSNWRIPTLEECKELIDNCTSEWTTLNGVNGTKFTSNINGNSIFLPAAGARGKRLNGAGANGYYRSSTQHPSASNRAYILQFDPYSAFIWKDSGRDEGFSVRPVVRN